MERLDEPSQIAESSSPDRSRRLRYDESGAAFEESKSDRRRSSPPSSSSSPSSASTQLSGAGRETGPGSPTTADAEQAVDPAAEAGQHQFSQAERFAHSWTARYGTERTSARASGASGAGGGPRTAAFASAVAHTVGPPSAEL